MKKCYKCKEIKSLDFFCNDKTKKDGKKSICKLCQKELRKNDTSQKYSPEYQLKYRKENAKKIKSYYTKEKNRERGQKYRKENLEKYREYQRNYRKQKRLEDINFKLSEIIRTNVRRVFKLIGTNKSDKTYSIVDYTAKDLKEHLESLFSNGMTWDNYGSVWDIDHTIPIKWFVDNKDNFQTIKDLCKKANSLENLKPLFFNENRTKGTHY